MVMAARAEVEDTARAMQDWVRVDKGMLSRLLYPNPVCMLSARRGAARSVMVLTWLTPVNNQGGFVCSVNASRHTAGFLTARGAIFVLNVPVRGMEELVLAVGGCSGGEMDKFDTLRLATCAPGGDALVCAAATSHTDAAASALPDTWPSNAKKPKKSKLSKKELAREEVTAAARTALALKDCVAHVLCRVERVTEDDGHLLLRCSQLAGWSRRAYWDGRSFIPRSDAHAEPYLTFLGSKTFGYVYAATSTGPRAPDVAVASTDAA